jgi:cytochrome c oxidase accessory protein FixG
MTAPHQDRDPFAGKFEESSSSLYAARKKVYPREQAGRFQSLRELALVVLLGLFYGLAWLPWDGRQAVLFDLPARKFHVLGLTFWPQDFFFLALLLMIAALSLFFFTALAGRLWCGYACPQTVWTELFLKIERWTEGDRMARMKLDRGPWDRNRLARKAAKQTLWVALALWTGFTFVGYFTPIRELGAAVLALETGPWETFWILFYGLATYGNAGYLREQVCMYMCPYARFQSAMFDKDTLVISYDEARGEQRGARKRGDDHKSKGLGDCIDCTLCVQVCPTGIDIRDGLQYECIACAACIDACDSVMDKVGYPRGLIKYTTAHALAGEPQRVLRKRTVLYGVLLLALCGLWIAGVALRSPVALDVLRDRNALYRLDDDAVENVYLLKVINRDGRDHRYDVSASGLAGLAVEVAHHEVGAAAAATHDDAAEVLDARTVVVKAGSVGNVAVRVRAARATVKGTHPIEIAIAAADDPAQVARETTRFFAPTR